MSKEVSGGVGGEVGGGGMRKEKSSFADIQIQEKNRMDFRWRVPSKKKTCWCLEAVYNNVQIKEKLFAETFNKHSHTQKKTRQRASCEMFSDLSWLFCCLRLLLMSVCLSVPFHSKKNSLCTILNHLVASFANHNYQQLKQRYFYLYFSYKYTIASFLLTSNFPQQKISESRNFIWIYFYMQIIIKKVFFSLSLKL